MRLFGGPQDLTPINLALQGGGAMKAVVLALGLMGGARDGARAMKIACSATFRREMRMFAHVRKQLPRRWMGLTVGKLERRLQQSRFHMIEAADVLGDFHAQTKLAANLKFFERLKQLGRSSTVDLDSLFY